MKHENKHTILDLVLDFNEANHNTTMGADAEFGSHGDIVVYLWNGGELFSSISSYDFDTIEDFIDSVKLLLI